MSETIRKIEVTDLDIAEADIHWYEIADTVFIAQRENGGHRHLIMFNRAEASQVIKHLQEFVGLAL